MVNLRIRKKLYCLVAAFLSMFAVCGNNLYAANGDASENDSSQSAQELKVGTKAPAFTLTSVDGKIVSLADFSKRYFVVLNFWASSSQESRKVNEEIAVIEKKYKDTDIIFVGISLDENKAAWQAAVKQDGLTGPQVSELKKLEDANVAKQYGVSSLPSVCIINPDGFIIGIENGNIDLTKKMKDIFGI
jgi:peroxiredoxin